MGFTSHLEITHMFFLITSLVAAVLFSFVAIRPGMRILNELCPRFFDRCDDLFTLGIEDGLYRYDPEIGRDPKELLQFETEMVLPLMYIAFGLAICVSWGAALFGASTLFCLVLSFLASLLPFALGLALLVAGAVMLTLHALFGAQNDTTGDASFHLAPAQPTSLADRAFDFLEDSSGQLKAFKKNPRSLVAFLGGLYDAARARLFSRRAKSRALTTWDRNR